jgi:F-type H+-transporting ATPase subunit a
LQQRALVEPANERSDIVEHNGGQPLWEIGPFVFVEQTGGHIGQHQHWEVGPFVVNADTMINTWITMAIVILIGYLAKRIVAKRQRIPSGWLNGVEFIFETLGAQFEQTLETKASRFAPLLITLFLFLLISNWLGLFPLFTSPTADLNTTLGLAVMIMGVVHLSGIRDKGVGYFKHFVKPHWSLLPIHLIDEIAKPATLAFRLFGNIVAGEILIFILAALVPFLLFPSVVWLAASTFIGIIQAFIFTMLSMSYIANVVKEEHHD